MKISKNLLIVSMTLIGIISSAQTNNVEETEMFNRIDADKNTVITVREMIDFYLEKTDENGEPIDAQKLFYGYDANRNSIVTLSEYVQGVDWKLANEFYTKWDENGDLKPKVEVKVDTVQTNKFAQIDFNFDDELSIKEVVSYYKYRVSKTTNKPINGELNFYAYDSDGDDKITKEEFLKKPNWAVARNKLKKNEEIEKKEVEDSIKEELTSEQITDEYLNEQIKLFNEADIDQNYKLSLKEVQDLYKDKKSIAGNEINAELRFYGMDTNNDNSVNLVEFTTTINWEVAYEKYSKEKFSVKDSVKDSVKNKE